MNIKNTPLNSAEKEKLHKLKVVSRSTFWVGIICTLFCGYGSYLFIELIYDEITTTRIRIQDAEIVDFAFLILFFSALAFIMIFLTFFAFRWMVISYYKRLQLIKKDESTGIKEIINGQLITAETRRQGLTLWLENQTEIAIDFSFLVFGGYKIIDSAILTQTEIEIWRLPHTNIAFQLKFPEFPEQIHKIYQDGKQQKNVSGIITLAISYKVGTNARYKGIKLDRLQMMTQIGNQPLRHYAKELPQPGTQSTQQLNSTTNL